MDGALQDPTGYPAGSAGSWARPGSCKILSPDRIWNPGSVLNTESMNFWEYGTPGKRQALHTNVLRAVACVRKKHKKLRIPVTVFLEMFVRLCFVECILCRCACVCVFV